MTFAYTVRCTFDDPAVAERWLQWLADEHLRDVCAAGAQSAQVIKLDDDDDGKVVCEARYQFAGRSAFEQYERDHAPRLREEGLRKFPLELGLRYERSTGSVVRGVGR